MEQNTLTAKTRSEREKALKVLQDGVKEGNTRLKQIDEETNRLQQQLNIASSINDARREALEVQGELLENQFQVNQAENQLEIFEDQLDLLDRIDDTIQNLASNDRERIKEQREALEFELSIKEAQDIIENQLFDLKQKQILAEIELGEATARIGREQSRQRELELEFFAKQVENRKLEKQERLIEIAAEKEKLRIQARTLAEKINSGALSQAEERRARAELNSKRGQLQALGEEQDGIKDTIDSLDKRGQLFRDQIDSQREITDAYDKQLKILDKQRQVQIAQAEGDREILRIKQEIETLEKEAALARTTSGKADDKRVKEALKQKQEELRIQTEINAERAIATGGASATGTTPRSTDTNTLPFVSPSLLEQAQQQGFPFPTVGAPQGTSNIVPFRGQVPINQQGLETGPGGQPQLKLVEPPVRDTSSFQPGASNIQNQSNNITLNNEFSFEINDKTDGEAIANQVVEDISVGIQSLIDESKFG